MSAEQTVADLRTAAAVCRYEPNGWPLAPDLADRLDRMADERERRQADQPEGEGEG